jgi:hypothetical protein
MVSNSVKSSVFEALKEHLNGMDAEFQSLTKKAEQTITLSTIIIGFATALNVFNLNQTQLGAGQKSIIFAAFLAYVGVLWFAIVVTRPKDWCGYPLDPMNVGNVMKMAEEEFEQHFLGAFVACLATNQRTIDDMAVRVAWASRLMVLEVFFVVLTKLV